MTSSPDILRAFAEHYQCKYVSISVCGERMQRIMECDLPKIPDAANLALAEPVTLEEIFQAIKSGKLKKASGCDGICHEFLSKMWEANKHDLLQIMNEMYRDAMITAQQKHGLLACIPKHAQALHIDDYRPLTILNTDYRLLTRIIAARLRPWLPEILQRSQYCCIPDNTVFDAIATIRDVVAHSEATGAPLCILTIDFQGAFGNLSHDYLFEVLRQYGFSDRFRLLIWNIYKDSTSTVQINGYRTRPIPIRSSVRQGCPLSMILFAMCLNPLLRTLKRSLHGVQIGNPTARTSIVAYVDDVTILVTTPSDIPKLRDAIHCYEKASEARVNIHKSRALAFGRGIKP
jgi:hypothetical protein